MAENKDQVYVLNRNVTHNGQSMKKGSKCPPAHINELKKYGYIDEFKQPEAPKEDPKPAPVKPDAKNDDKKDDK